MTEREPKEIDSKVFDSIRLWIASRNDTTKAGLMVLTDLVDQLELDFQKERREREAAQRLAGSIDRLHTQGMKDFEAMKERAESAEKRVSEVERELDRTKIKAASGMLRDEVVEANHYRIKALEAALREAQSALHESFVCTGYHNIGESSYYEQVLAVIKAALYLKSAEAHESAPKDRVILLDNGGSLLSQPPKPPAPGASEAPECAHVDTLGRGKCDRCGIWEEEYRLLIEPKAKEAPKSHPLGSHLGQACNYCYPIPETPAPVASMAPLCEHDYHGSWKLINGETEYSVSKTVMRECPHCRRELAEDKELGDLAAKRDASAKPEDYVPLEELTAPAPSDVREARRIAQKVSLWLWGREIKSEVSELENQLFEALIKTDVLATLPDLEKRECRRFGCINGLVKTRTSNRYCEDCNGTGEVWVRRGK